MNILFVADIVGRPGRRAVRALVPGLRERYGIDLCIANAENAAHGFGLTPLLADEILASGVDVLTSGNHIWDRKELLPYLEKHPSVLRPANYPPGVVGRGATVHILEGGDKVGVLCLQGRVFMHETDCPFRIADGLLGSLREETPIILVDFHAEATSEKVAMGRYLDGRVSAVMGTHTHVQTADEQILPAGTAYLTDAGMTGPHDSVIGMDAEAALRRFLTQVMGRLEVARGRIRLSGVVISVDRQTGRAKSIRRLHESLPEG
ncbi:MAG: TIGR00282 family metallophosphoesterase [Candidatus Eisenbacteria sp.]|nr:TIGR00282 family metallophosphoesterase [Candidatus Eisenbacteria bacterium]